MSKTRIKHLEPSSSSGYTILTGAGGVQQYLQLTGNNKYFGTDGSGTAGLFDLPVSADTMGGNIRFTIFRNGSLPAGNSLTEISTTFSSINGVVNGSPANYSISGNTLTIQPGKYIVFLNALVELDTNSGTTSTIYSMTTSGGVNIGSAVAGQQYYQMQYALNGGGNNNGYQTTMVAYVIEPTTALSVNLSTLSSSYLSRPIGFSTSAPITINTEFQMSIYKLK